MGIRNREGRNRCNTDKLACHRESHRCFNVPNESRRLTIHSSRLLGLCLAHPTAGRRRVNSGVTREFPLRIDPMKRDGKYTSEHTVVFTRTAWTDRVRTFAPYLPKEAPLFAAVTASFWGVAEVLSEIGGQTLSLKHLAVPALVTAFSASFYKAVQKYRTYVPESLCSESKASQSIYRKGKYGWQFALALQMLKERTETSDRALQRIENGAHFAAPTHFDESDYLAWIKRRPEVLIRLIRAVSVQYTNEMPSVLAKPLETAFLANLKDSVSQLCRLYEATVEFELESRAACPPEKFEPANEMTFDWSNPIRDGVREFLSVLKQLSEIDPKTATPDGSPPPTFSIKFSPPPNIDSFIRELERVVRN